MFGTRDPPNKPYIGGSDKANQEGCFSPRTGRKRFPNTQWGAMEHLKRKTRRPDDKMQARVMARLQEQSEQILKGAAIVRQKEKDREDKLFAFEKVRAVEQVKHEMDRREKEAEGAIRHKLARMMPLETTRHMTVTLQPHHGLVLRRLRQ